MSRLKNLALAIKEGFNIATADWDESAHPRDDHGRFGEGGSQPDKVLAIKAEMRSRERAGHGPAIARLGGGAFMNPTQKMMGASRDEVEKAAAQHALNVKQAEKELDKERHDRQTDLKRMSSDQRSSEARRVYNEARHIHSIDNPHAGPTRLHNAGMEALKSHGFSATMTAQHEPELKGSRS